LKLFVKYMVSDRCKMLVKSELDKLGIQFKRIELGEVDLLEDLPKSTYVELNNNLLESGLELIENKKIILVEKIKISIIEMIHYSDDLPKVNYSDYISEKLGYDYTYLSNLFTEQKGITIQQYIIINKIEKVKEFLLYEDLNLSEISYKLHYSSVAHLSNQFRRVTGLTPTAFKQLQLRRTTNLENL
jgi:AraC-like DNA-binding protein